MKTDTLSSTTFWRRIKRQRNRTEDTVTLKALTPRQQLFVDHYVLHGVGGLAAREAGYGTAGSRVAAHRLLTNANVQAAISAARVGEAQKMQMQRDDVIAAINCAFTIAVEKGNPAAMVQSAREIGRLCGFYDPESIRQQGVPRPLRETPRPELLRQLADGGDFRSLDGSPMDESAIEDFYRNLSREELLALADGRARVESRVVMLEETG